MRHKMAQVALLVGAVLAVLGAGAHPRTSRLEPLATPPAQTAAVAPAAPALPVVAGRAGSTNTRGWIRPSAFDPVASWEQLPSDLRAAYGLAVFVAPTTCHL